MPHATSSVRAGGSARSAAISAADLLVPAGPLARARTGPCRSTSRRTPAPAARSTPASPDSIAHPWRCRSPRPSCPSSPRRRARCRPATAGSTSRSGTASARSRSSTAATVDLQSRNGRPLTRYFPELAFPDGPLRARRRDRAVRRRGPPGLRRARPADPPGEVAHRHARREDADAVHRLRPARARRRGAARAAAGRAARPPRAASSTSPSTSRPRPRTPPRPSRGCTAPRA